MRKFPSKTTFLVAESALHVYPDRSGNATSMSTDGDHEMAPALENPNPGALLGSRAGIYHCERRQRSRWDLHVFANGSAVRLLAALDDDPHYGGADRRTGNGRAYGSRDGQRPQRPDTRRIRPAHHGPRDVGIGDYELRQYCH